MDLVLPFHSCTFDDITMTSSGYRGNPIFFVYNSLFLKKWNHPSNSNFVSSIYFFFLNSGNTEEMQCHLCVCILGHEEPQKWFNPGVGRGCIPSQ